MPVITNSYAFLANYNAMAACLAAIRQQELDGIFDADDETLRLLRNFEADVLRKLYNRTLRILGTIDGYVPAGPEYLQGDFEEEDFSHLDFYTGYLPADGTGYSLQWSTILNIFAEFARRITELSEADKTALNLALVPVLEAFDEIKAHLALIGLNPCVDTGTVLLNNDPGSVYLQAAGSDGSGGIPEGIHLRWSLAGDLGEQHLPKGDYANELPDPEGYNRPDDYIRVYRTPYQDPVQVTIDFETARPAINFSTRRWTYIMNTRVAEQAFVSTVRLVFKDAGFYRSAALSHNPLNDPFGFMQAYQGTMELELVGKTAFSAGFEITGDAESADGQLRVEIISINPSELPDGNMIAARKIIAAGAGETINQVIYAENIDRIKLHTFAGASLRSFSFETYHDFLATRAESDWTTVGESFALSLTDAVAFERLESEAYPVDNLWPQYNGGTTVKAASYRDKWNVSGGAADPSLKEAVADYLELSLTDPRAEKEFEYDNDPGNPGLVISYLDVLNVMALDYHLARMLGLAHIDTPVTTADTERFVYRVKYTNRKSLGSQTLVTYQYMSLPTAKTDSRNPSKPAIRPLTYSLPVDNQLSETLFDARGYSAISTVRVVNIGREPVGAETGDQFITNLLQNDEFNVFEQTVPILYGIEYRRDGQETYVKPEITAAGAIGPVYEAYGGDGPGTEVPETVPVPDHAESLYVHLEKEEGIHYYAIYGINWFSRASVLSDEAATDATTFPARNGLLPPTDIEVQYIQQEDTLLFTTETEQQWLAGRSSAFEGQEVNFTRIAFNWLDITDISYLENIGELATSDRVVADHVKVWFKPGVPLEVKGKIRRIGSGGAPDRLLIASESYQLVDDTVIVPAIDPADYGKFVNSVFTTPEGQFRVLEVMNGGPSGPVFLIEKALLVENVADENDPGVYGTREYYQSPVKGSRFTLVENLGNSDNWEPVSQVIPLVNLSDTESPEVEIVTDNEGNISKYLVGGITAGALVEPVSTDPELAGYYTITFAAGTTLDPHSPPNLPFDPANPSANAPDALHTPHIEWYKGLVRVPEAADAESRKVLEVVRIAQSAPLVLYAYDPGHQDSQVAVSLPGDEPSIMVNFHPGYRAYFFPEAIAGHAFNRSNIQPSGEEIDKKTLIGLQTAASEEHPQGFASRISTPAILMARKPEVLARPAEPVIYGLKVRPDATAKAAFTLDTALTQDGNGVAQPPFGWMFYRVSHEDILYALYAPATVTSILDALAGLTEDADFNQRYSELANLQYNESAGTGHFNVFEALPAAYGFPVPDKAGLVNAEDSPEVKHVKYQAAIRGTLLPLTEQPPLWPFIKTGYQTENKLPRIRSVDGYLLNVSDAEFDPFPMVRKFTDTEVSYIRFTDYSLVGSSRFLYFYCAAEINSQLIAGPLSPFAGPVSILQTLPAEPPVIRSFTVDLATDPVAVSFHISPVTPGDPIDKVRIYRSFDITETAFLHTMPGYIDVDPETDDAGGIVVTDTFSGFTVIPLGETIYYRLVFIRTILNEEDAPEEVLSLGSDVVTVNLVDATNPEAPELLYDEATNTLSWQATANRAGYYLLKQNDRGNWQKITAEPLTGSGLITYPLAAPLVMEDENGDPVYHRFKVNVTNASGLMSLQEKAITIPDNHEI